MCKVKPKLTKKLLNFLLVGRSCQKRCTTVHRPPPAGLQLAFGKAAKAYTKVQDHEIKSIWMRF